MIEFVKNKNLWLKSAMPDFFQRKIPISSVNFFFIKFFFWKIFCRAWYELSFRLCFSKNIEKVKIKKKGMEY